MIVDFELGGIQLHRLNGGPEVDRFWDSLVDGGVEQPCGWVKDRFGVSWQVVPTAYYDVVDRGDAAAIERAAVVALQTFGKLDVAAVEAAPTGE